MVRIFHSTQQIISDFLLPPRCGHCSAKVAEHDHLCASCMRDLIVIADNYCASCGIPFEVPMPKGSLCGSCMQQKPLYDQAISATVYGGTAKDLTLKLKHGKKLLLAQVMVPLMVNSWQRAQIDIDPHNSFVIPVALHWRRLFARRFNQSALLAQKFAKQINIPYNPDILRRKLNTRSQGGLDRKERQKNVKSAFFVAPQHRKLVENKDIILIDDVMTTGSTIDSCTKTLKQAGAQSVFSVCFSRVVPYL